MVQRTSLTILCVFLVAGSALPQDAQNIASRISTALDGNNLAKAINLWTGNEDAILDSSSACITTAKAFLRFAAGELAMRYQEIPEDCTSVALECLDAAERALPESDNSRRLLVARGLLDAAGIYLVRGHGDKAGGLQDRALELLKTATAAETVPEGAYVELCRVYQALASRDPVHAEEHLARAAAALDRAGELSGLTSALHLKVGENLCALAETLEKRLLKSPEDAKLQKAVRTRWCEGLEAFDDGLKLASSNRALRTAYNECLWDVERVTKGKCRRNPIAKTHTARYGKLKLALPESSWWRITELSKLEDKDDLFIALKVNKRRHQRVYIKLDQYRWDANYINEKTGSTVGGDNIRGLAQRAERYAKMYFEDVREQIPLRVVSLNERFPQAEAFAFRGMDKDGELLEYRCIYFKARQIQRTYRLLVIADMGTLERNPYELDYILASTVPVSLK